MKQIHRADRKLHWHDIGNTIMPISARCQYASTQSWQISNPISAAIGPISQTGRCRPDMTLSCQCERHSPHIVPMHNVSALYSHYTHSPLRQPAYLLSTCSIPCLGDGARGEAELLRLQPALHGFVRRALVAFGVASVGSTTATGALLRRCSSGGGELVSPSLGCFLQLLHEGLSLVLRSPKRR